MWQAFVIVLREGFEAFLMVAITLAYLQKTRREDLCGAVGAGIAASLAVSALIGLFLYKTDSNQPLWEGVLGLVSAILVGAFVVHMWKTAPHLKQDMERTLEAKTHAPSSKAAWMGVFGFIILMISREGMETALMLFQVHTAGVVTGALLGAAGAAAIAMIWTRVGRLINLKLFFQVTSLFLLLFVVQILIYSFHEFTETGLIPNVEFWHDFSEPYGPEGRYGRWYSVFMVGACALWLVWAWIADKKKAKAV
jgi:high-affinity iron transporter